MFKFVYNYKVNLHHSSFLMTTQENIITLYSGKVQYMSCIGIYRCETSWQKVYLALMHITTQRGSYTGSAAVEIKYIAGLQHW